MADEKWTKKLNRAAQDYQIAVDQWETRKHYLPEPYRTMHQEAIKKAEAKCKALGIPGF